MGQKVNPISLRLLNLNRHFDSSWYEDYNYTDLLLQDYRIKSFFKLVLDQIDYPEQRIGIESSPKKIDVNLFYFNPTSGSSSRYKNNKRYSLPQKIDPDNVSEKKQLIYKIEALQVIGNTGKVEKQGLSSTSNRQNVSNCNTVFGRDHIDQICVQPPEVPDTFYLYPDNDLPSGYKKGDTTKGKAQTGSLPSASSAITTKQNRERDRNDFHTKLLETFLHLDTVSDRKRLPSHDLAPVKSNISVLSYSGKKWKDARNTVIGSMVGLTDREPQTSNRTQPDSLSAISPSRRLHFFSNKRCSSLFYIRFLLAHYYDNPLLVGVHSLNQRQDEINPTLNFNQCYPANRSLLPLYGSHTANLCLFSYLWDSHEKPQTIPSKTDTDPIPNPNLKHLIGSVSSFVTKRLLRTHIQLPRSNHIKELGRAEKVNPIALRRENPAHKRSRKISIDETMGNPFRGIDSEIPKLNAASAPLYLCSKPFCALFFELRIKNQIQSIHPIARPLNMTKIVREKPLFQDQTNLKLYPFIDKGVYRQRRSLPCLLFNQQREKEASDPLQYKDYTFIDCLAHSVRKSIKIPSGLYSTDGHYNQELEKRVECQYKQSVNLTFFNTLSEKQGALGFIQEIIHYIEQRVPFRKIKASIHRSLRRNKKIKGIRITCSGRVGGRSKKAQRSKTQKVIIGETSLGVFSSKIDFACKSAHTVFGSIGVKLWICYK